MMEITMDVDDEASTEDVPAGQEVDLVTMMMLILDEIHFPPPQSPMYDVFGGAGSFVVVGARLFSPPPLSRTVSWIVDQGSDFPLCVDKQLRGWSTSVVIRCDSSRPTTRAWNGYTLGGVREFHYTTPKLRLEVNDLSSAQLLSKSFHMFCSPARCMSIVNNILPRRRALDKNTTRPIIVWEPIDNMCNPAELSNLTNTLPLVDVCSPDHASLAQLMGDVTQGMDLETGQVSREAVERACEQLLSAMPLQSYTMVVRCGAAGCYIAKNGGRSRRPSLSKKKKRRPATNFRGGLTAETDMFAMFADLTTTANGDIERDEIEINAGMEVWLPAVHDGDDDDDTNDTYEANGDTDISMNGDDPQHASSSDLGPHRVIDPTGAGNAFLGALAVALARGKGIVEAAMEGSVAASFVVEQVGMPTLGFDERGRETWNGRVVEERLERFRDRCGR